MPDMILADTSVWIKHFREGQTHLISLLEQGFIACHPFIIGELACGSLKNRSEIINLLEALPKVKVLEHSEAMEFIESQELMSLGIGYIDTHLLGSSLISDCPLWTFDKALKKTARFLNTAYNGK